MKEIQEKIKQFCKEHNLESSPEVRILDIMSELGEVSKEILKMNNYGKKEIEYNDEIKSEIGDLFFSLITLANSLDINLEEALNIILNKYEKRLKKGSAGSEVEKNGK